MDTASTAEERIARIRELNDTLRTYGRGGEVYLTRGVAARGDDFIARAFRAVADFSAFTEDNDPHGEHRTRTHLAFVQIAMIWIMMRRLARTSAYAGITGQTLRLRTGCWERVAAYRSRRRPRA